MKRKLTFKYTDVVALVLCIAVPVLLTIITTGFFQLAMLLYSYVFGCGYVVLSCVFNRIILPKTQLSRMRIICELAFAVFLISNIIKWCINEFGNDVLQHMDTSWLYTMYFAIPVFALLYIVVTIQELIKLRKATKPVPDTGNINTTSNWS